ncbi:family 78 glycoside hydrolase catalytic domain [Candidatus Latescibacterota bacterium]
MNLKCLNVSSLYAFTLLFILIAAAGCGGNSSDVTIHSLQCEYLDNPLGIDVTSPRLSWKLSSNVRGQKQTAYEINIADSKEHLLSGGENIRDRWKVNSDRSVHVNYEGAALTSKMESWWRVRIWDKDGNPSEWSEPAMWTMGLLTESDWQSEWIGADWQGDPAPSLPWLRKTFELENAGERAMAYVCALGYYELYINGKKVDDHVLAPAVTDFSKRTLYVAHDITDYLTEGTNCVALWRGRGWYVEGHPGVIHNGPLVRAQIHIFSQDEDSPDNERIIATDTSWKAHPSPITPLGKGLAFGDYGGERYNARAEMPDWNTAGLDDSGWQQAVSFDPPEVPSSAQMVQPNRITRTITPTGVEKLPTGEYLIDMGTNYTGWFTMNFPGGGKKGSTVKLEYGDSIRDGTRLRTYNQIDEYIMSGGTDETFRTRMNYHAFRWVKVSGLENEPSLGGITGHLIHTGYSRAGSFECSNELLNNIYDTVVHTYRCLTLGGYVVDCPHRERLGYGGDAGTSLETAMFNFDTGALYTKWLGNWRDAQDPETGDLPHTAPAYPEQGGGGPMWGGFCTTLPWQLYLHYGDERILDISYPIIVKWLAFLESKSKDNILEPYVSYGISMPQWNFLGDWLAPNRGENLSRERGRVDANSSKFLNNAYFLYNLQIASKIAALLNKPGDAAMFAQKAETLEAALNNRYFDAENNSYANGEQPYLAFPLLLGMVPEGHRSAVMDSLENAIMVRRNGHLNAGMHGLYFLLEQLMKEERNDLIFEMVNKKTYPGWGYMLENGATTMWESWTGGSHIHDTLISIGSWYIQGLGGIQIDEESPGFKNVLIKPQIIGDLTHLKASYNSIHGMISDEWRLSGNTLELNVTVPPNTTATVFVPSVDADGITESGNPAGKSEGVTFLRMENGTAVFSVESGNYSFISNLPG